MKLKVVEKFISINGEGPLVGQLAVFIRFAYCNLRCSYCDTSWANADDVSYELMTPNDIYNFIKKTGIKNVTLTGGEPLLQDGIFQLLEIITKDKELQIEIETNGSVPLDRFSKLENPPSFTMDYKLPSSKMEGKMDINNFKYLSKRDSIKFVSGDMTDLLKAKEIIEKYNLKDKMKVYISPVFGKISMQVIVDFMKENKLNNVSLQVQLHKIVWDPNRRGV